MSMTYLIFGILLIFLISRMLPVKGLQELTPDQVAGLLKEPQGHLFIDVREPYEYERGHIPGFRNVPLSQLPSRHHELPKDRPIVLTCQSGMRSRRAAKFLLTKGVHPLSHLKTGVSGWTGPLSKGRKRGDLTSATVNMKAQGGTPCGRNDFGVPQRQPQRPGL